MGMLSSIISFALCAIVYVRMLKREVREPMSKKQAWVPVAVGVIGPIISTLVAVGLGMLIFKLRGGELTQAGISVQPTQPEDMNLVAASLLRAFRNAGFTEELVKLLLALLMVKIFKPKNVYEYALAFIGIGFGFTALEEILYGGGVRSLIRLPGFAMHMVFGIIMGVNLGLARYEKQQGGSPGKYILCGLLVPVLWHTLYDAGTAFNAGIDAADENAQSAGLIIGVLSIIVSTVLEFVLLIKFKKKAVTYSEMELQQQFRTT